MFGLILSALVLMVFTRETWDVEPKHFVNEY